ncbi:hypothetical protein FGIG_09411, partial [Fasciola gigantica]
VEASYSDRSNVGIPWTANVRTGPYGIKEHEPAESFRINRNQISGPTNFVQPRKMYDIGRLQTHRQKQFYSRPKPTGPKESSYALIDREKRMKSKQMERIMSRNRLKQVGAEALDKPNLDRKSARTELTIKRPVSRFQKAQSESLLNRTDSSRNLAPIYRPPQKVRFAAEKNIKPECSLQANSCESQKLSRGPKSWTSASSLDTLPTTLSRHKSHVLKSANIRRQFDNMTLSGLARNSHNAISDAKLSRFRKQDITTR